MSMSLNLTWPSSIRLILDAEPRSSRPASARLIPAASRSLRSRTPRTIRRAVGLTLLSSSSSFGAVVMRGPFGSPACSGDRFVVTYGDELYNKLHTHARSNHQLEGMVVSFR